MGWIEVDDQIDERMRELGRRWGVSKGDALARVLQEWGGDGPPGPAVSYAGDDDLYGDPDGRIAVYFDYKGVHNAALFEPSTGELEVTAGPARGTHFPSPSSAATKIVGLLNPSVSASRNGWITWRLVDTDEFIDSLRPGAGT